MPGVIVCRTDHDPSKCSDNKRDCCASLAWGEPQTCDDGYAPTPDPSCTLTSNPGCSGYMDNVGCYGCFPPEAAHDPWKCSDIMHDCCASDTWGEPQTCYDGYAPIPDPNCTHTSYPECSREGVGSDACYGCFPPQVDAMGANHGIDRGLLQAYYWVDDGCQIEAGMPGSNSDDVVGSYVADNSPAAAARCCNGLVCTSPMTCPSSLTFAEASARCIDEGMRLCTKAELLSDICCGTGGYCDSYAVWTSTAEAATGALEDIDNAGGGGQLNSIVCENPRTGACRERFHHTNPSFWSPDNDCCASKGDGGCADGYVYVGQVHLWDTATSDLDGFFRLNQGTCKVDGNTCCVEASPSTPAPTPTPALQTEGYEALIATTIWVFSILAVAVVVIGLCFAFRMLRRRRCPWGRKGAAVVWDSGAPHFYFLPASFFHDSSCTSLPPMQHLHKEARLVKRRVCLLEAFGNPNSMKNTLFISHRWESPEYPDMLGHQFTAVKDYLVDNPHVDYVWYDWSCMPQNCTWGGSRMSRTPEEEEEFRCMLGSIADLYLTSSILILLDKTYMTRFWTLLEAWCAMVTPTTSGVRAATRSERRFVVKPMHNAVPKDREGLEELVFDKAPSVIHDILACPDVVVTNMKDKDLMLPVVSTLDSHVQHMMNACKADVHV